MISDAYRKLQEEMHQNPAYGVASIGYAPLVVEYLKQCDAREILDYGSGKCRLAGALEKLLPETFECVYYAYDPGIPHLSAAPEPREFVACIDVLEHVEPEHLDAVLDDLKRVMLRNAFVTVHTGPAIKTLPDGRNAHLIQRAPAFWLEKLSARFNLLASTGGAIGFWVFLGLKR